MRKVYKCVKEEATQSGEKVEGNNNTNYAMGVIIGKVCRCVYVVR